MSVTPEPVPLGSPISLFDHSLSLHEKDPDSPLPRDGEPYPDNDFNRRRSLVPRSEDRRAEGADVARILDEYFAAPDATPRRLVTAFHQVHVPIHRNDHIAAAALRADKNLVHQAGRWLVRHSNYRSSVVVGLALLATGLDEEDLPLIKTIGLLSNSFGALAAETLQRRCGGLEALLWLAPRVTGWGRVYVVEALCRVGALQARPWLLRSACDGDYLNGYFAGKIATAAHLHEAITGSEPDDDLIDHTGRLLATMADCQGMGMTLEHYPPAHVVLRRHVELLENQNPTMARYLATASLINDLAQKQPHRLGCTAGQRHDLLNRYTAVLNRADWSHAVRAGFDPANDYHVWITGKVATRLGLTPFE